MSKLKSSLIILLLPALFSAIILGFAQSVQAQGQGLTLLAKQIAQSKSSVSTLKVFQKASQSFYQDITQINPQLPGLSTARVEFYQDLIIESILAGDYPAAYQQLGLAEKILEEVLANQEQIIQAELARLSSLVEESLAEAENLFIDTASWKSQYDALLREDFLGKGAVKASLGEWQGLQEELARAIFLRRLQSRQAVKSIVVKKDELKMYLYEDERLVFSLPLSLGRPGFGTRTGQFQILDKLDTVWGIWQIYLPYWMGIYWAGASENGIHGLPWDKAGNVYWQADVGARNVTYGCVMGFNEQIAKVYQWAEIGTPVTIVN